jgi:LacI family transcriptional regulator
LALDRAVARWLTLLHKPVGVLAPNDVWAYQLLEVCRQKALRVPDDVALVGVDNDDLLCGLARPPLTSVATPAERVGYEAAALLDRLMASPGRADGAPPLPPLPPLGVVARQSTDVLMVDDPAVAAAVRFIRERACTPIGVEDLLRAVPLPRRTLERRFRAALGRGPGEEIRRTRVERARYLLGASRSSMGEVARAAGFADAKHFCVAFRRHTGQSPSSYRREFRHRPGT